jgi:hypothetical protein
VVACLPLDPRFAGPYPVENDGVVIEIKIRGTTSFGGKIKQSVPCRKILQHVKETFEV